MRALAILLRRDLAILLPGGARGAAFLPLIFFLLVAVLFPFAVGPEPGLLARTGGGVLWVAALLASILPLDRLVAAGADVLPSDAPGAWTASSKQSRDSLYGISPGYLMPVASM